MLIFLQWILSWFFTSEASESGAAFELYKDKADEFRFRLKSHGGDILLASEGYTTQKSARNGIDSVKVNALLDKNYERKTAKNGQFTFNLKALNYKVIGTSGLYVTRRDRDEAVVLIKRYACDAMIKDLTVV